jgi:hypothetical protein
MEHDEMYFVIGAEAITLDEMGTAVVCDLNSDGTVDWESFDVIDWMDLNPVRYELFKACVDFLQQHTPSPLYIK